MPWFVRWNLAKRILRGEFHMVRQIQWGEGEEIITLETRVSVSRRYPNE